MDSVDAWLDGIEHRSWLVIVSAWLAAVGVNVMVLSAGGPVLVALMWCALIVCDANLRHRIAARRELLVLPLLAFGDGARLAGWDVGSWAGVVAVAVGAAVVVRMWVEAR